MHRGERVIEGSAERVSFRHADGSRYGEAVNPVLIDVHAKVFKALCKLGFRDGEAPHVLDGLRREPGAATVTVEGLLREALGRLTSALGLR